MVISCGRFQSSFSANFSTNGLTTPYREILAETTRDTFTPLNDYIYVALMDEDNNEFYYQKHKFDTNEKSLQIITDQKPAKAGLDPFLVLIDRNMDNNKMRVKKL